ncbi:hypothetical protein Ate02nite_05380 [Paractinoplanes tereljensis]|uniref:Uncharacterized protein n=1 Tax=Paractinoplanes tereljensis TaxID=571912 RepID=A0A919TPC0_9ACTN|nr:hypothetical protein Ate02nite_05380 [Actinoplanes tereljensis]
MDEAMGSWGKVAEAALALRGVTRRVTPTIPAELTVVNNERLVSYTAGGQGDARVCDCATQCPRYGRWGEEGQAHAGT